MRPQDTPARAYAATRYHLLSELRCVRAMLRVGNATEANARRSRKGLQRDMAALRQSQRRV